MLGLPNQCSSPESPYPIHRTETVIGLTNRRATRRSLITNGKQPVSTSPACGNSGADVSGQDAGRSFRTFFAPSTEARTESMSVVPPLQLRANDRLWPWAREPTVVPDGHVDNSCGSEDRQASKGEELSDPGLRVALLNRRSNDPARRNRHRV
jgi:hypothetical protein